MKVNFTARHFDLSDDIREHAEERLERLDRFFDGLLSANVVLDVEKYRQIAEITVRGRNGNFTGKAESTDMFSSVDQAYEKIERQVKKHADKLRNHQPVSKGALAMGDTRIESEKRNREMMTLDEATSRLESGEEIVVFSDTDSGATRVVYRRADGSMKMIEVA